MWRTLKYLLLLVEVCEYRKTPFASELGTAHNDGFTGHDGDIKISWICFTDLQKQNQSKTPFEHDFQITIKSYFEVRPTLPLLDNT